MIIYGQYLKSNGIFRPYLKALVLGSNGVYTALPFIIDTGADSTFLPFRDYCHAKSNAVRRSRPLSFACLRLSAKK